MRKVIIPIIAAAAILFGSTQSFGATVTLTLVLVDSTHWQVWAVDNDNSGNLGIDGLGFTITPSSGTVTCTAAAGMTAPEDTVDNANGDIMGFSNFGTYGSNKASLTIGAFQQTAAGTLQQDVDSVVFGVGQSAAAINNNGNFIGYTDTASPPDVVTVNLHSSTSNGNNIAGNGLPYGVEFFAGTNSVANSISLTSFNNAQGGTTIGVDVFTLSQPSDGGDYSALASTTTPPSVTMVLAPEPASLALLGLGGLLILGPRRSRRRA